MSAPDPVARVVAALRPFAPASTPLQLRDTAAQLCTVVALGEQPTEAEVMESLLYRQREGYIALDVTRLWSAATAAREAAIAEVSS